ncbi:hypothetical protein AAWM_00453 [Aspergillus awamori]|uniref:Uncharacterized protein n=1 Tax=Aspergillus awamori TaxID=105351 RepID=A0A401KE51_ASPAW|nr:hypothetical protein AAWM_00453 [Aspergillus awamori]
MSATSTAGIVAERCMDYDDVAWARCDEIFEPWRDKIFETDVLREIGRFIDKHRGGVPEELFAPQRGSFNAWLRMLFKDGGSAIIRFPCPGASMFPEEKVQREVAVMQFLEYFTNLRIPHILHHGITEESPKELGPFIIMEHISNEGDFIDALNIPGRSRDDRPILDPNVSQERLEWIYIGCIGKAKENDEIDDTWIVKHRPLTFNMNELVQLGGISPDLLPQGTFKTASSYYRALAEMHMIHLSSQRNDAIDSAEDCRNNFARTTLASSGQFRLFCDDLRPGNVLANDQHQMTGVVDWEFTYAAPTGFAHSPPFWLLLELPELWKPGLDDWTARYEKVLPTFLKVVKNKEQAAIDRGTLKEPDRLSEHMWRSWQSGDFWLNYAARKSWAFDMIYWARIDRRFFGAGDLNDRIKLLTPEEREEMDKFVQIKFKAKEEGGLSN